MEFEEAGRTGDDMNISITVLVAVVGCVLSCISFWVGQKKVTGEEAAKRARFEGMIDEKLNNLIKSVDKLDSKLSKSTTELYDEIDKRIAEHEKRYHKQ